MTTAILPLQNPFNKPFLNVQQTSRHLGLSPSTVRSMFDFGELGGHVTPVGNHRRISWDSIQTYLGFDSAKDDEGGKGRIACYIRVSSVG
jgi:excisionase family DNA binding protein